MRATAAADAHVSLRHVWAVQTLAQHVGQDREAPYCEAQQERHAAITGCPVETQLLPAGMCWQTLDGRCQEGARMLLRLHLT